MNDSTIYNEDAYNKFADEFHRVIHGPNIRKVDLKWLEPRAKSAGIRTNFGSYGWRSAISSRIAPKTVYLGSSKVRLPHPTAGSGHSGTQPECRPRHGLHGGR
ncbi:MAG: hypothetical protein KJ768_05740 [Acidobacteria bacterium]|nr:hypothetical protein [Acidobacteriota bacterium]